MTNNPDTMQHHHPTRISDTMGPTIRDAQAQPVGLVGRASLGVSCSVRGRRQTRKTNWRLAAVMGLTLGMASCASLSVKRDTATSGTFNSSARSFTLFSYSFPRPSIQIAHENIADAGLPNTHATRVSHTDWGWFDWLLEIISVRSARVKGTWGFNGESLGLDPSVSSDS